MTTFLIYWAKLTLRIGSHSHSGDYFGRGIQREAIRRYAGFSASSQIGGSDTRAAEDNMNVQLKDITVTARDGRVSHLEQVYIRGSHVRFFIVPDMLRNAPMFRSRGTRGRGVGLARGRATVIRARGARGGR